MRIAKALDLARAIKNERHDQGITQQQLAETVGITRQTLSRLEQGDGGVSLDTYLRILDVLNITVDVTTQPQAETGQRGSSTPVGPGGEPATQYSTQAATVSSLWLNKMITTRSYEEFLQGAYFVPNAADDPREDADRKVEP